VAGERTLIRIALACLAVAILTMLTQIGGLALLLAIGIARIVNVRKVRRHTFTAALLIAIYAVASITLVPPLAALGGRVPLACMTGDAPLRPASLVYCALNRHYVRPRLAGLADQMSRALERRYPGTEVRYLDAGFPFVDGFPLFPHLSHDDGRKLDLALFYREPDNSGPSDRLRSPVGYFAFEPPLPGDPEPCSGREGPMRWDLSVVQPLWFDLPLDERRTRDMVEWLASEGRALGTGRIFLEPHLVRRLGLQSDIVRFQGCDAARHDDHVHVEVR